MRSRGVLVLAAVALVGIAALVAAALSKDSDVAFTIDAHPGEVAARLIPGQEVCEAPIVATDRFTAVRFSIGTYRGPGQPLAVTLRTEPGGPATGTPGMLPAGYADGSTQTVVVGDVSQSGRAVCVQNRGTAPVAIYGSRDDRRDPPLATVDGEVLTHDLALVFVAADPTSLAGFVPEMVSRAALLTPDPLGEWTFWLLAALVVAGIPFLLALALRDATDE